MCIFRNNVRECQSVINNITVISRVRFFPLEYLILMSVPVLTGRDRLRLTALTTNHHGDGEKANLYFCCLWRDKATTAQMITLRYSCTYGATYVGYNLKPYDRTIVYQGGQNIGWFIVSDKSKMSRLVVTAYAG